MSKYLRVFTVLILCATMLVLFGCQQSTPESTTTSSTPTVVTSEETTSEAPNYDAAREFYKDKDVTLIVPLAPGGGMDNAARQAAPFLQELLGCKSVIVENMEGASGIVAANYMYNTAKKDGTVICFGSQTASQQYVLKDDAVQFESTEFNYIATIQRCEMALVVTPDSPYATDIEAFKNADSVTLGGFAYNDGMSLRAAVILEAMQCPNPLLIGGYGGSSKCLLAMAQGEIVGYACPLDSLYRYVNGGQAVPLLIIANERDKYWPDVPTLSEVFDLNEQTQHYLELIEPSDRIIYAPPDVPEDRIDFIEYCCMEMINDPDFQQVVIDSTGYFGGSLDAEGTKQVCMDTIENAEETASMNYLIDKYIK